MIFDIFDRFFDYRPVLHISGGYKTGKSILIKDYISSHFAHHNTTPNNFYIIDTENKFAKNGYKKSISSRFMKNNIFVCKTPTNESLITSLRELMKKNFNPGDFLIIDSISEYIKKTMAKNELGYLEWKHEVDNLKYVFIPLLQRLIMKKKIRLILVHHISYNPSLDTETAYYNDIFQNIKGIWLNLSPSSLENRIESKIHSLNTMTFSYTYEGITEFGEIYDKVFTLSYTYKIEEGKISVLKRI